MSIGMTIGYIFVILYTTSDIFTNKKIVSYSMIIILFIYSLTNMVNIYILTYNHKVANEIDKLKVNDISKYIEEYEEQTGIEVKYITMKYFKNTKKGYYKKANSINSFAIYSECSYDGIINFYTKKQLKEINLTSELNRKYIYERKGEDKFICIDNILVCPIYNI